MRVRALVVYALLRAGHSAITFLWQRPSIKVVSFDVGTLDWAAESLRLVQRIYPGRVERITGWSTDTLPAFAHDDARKFDLFAIDGGHAGEVPYADMRNGRNVSRPGAYVLIDDWTETNRDVKAAWARAQAEGFITQVLCVDEGVVVFGAQKAYCLGRYT